MDPLIAKVVVVVANMVMIAIRAPHGRKSREIKVVRSGRGVVENVLLTVAWIGYFTPLLWVATEEPSFANYPLHLLLLLAGCVFLLLGLWLLFRSHADLGVNWSITLEVREQHRLITAGVYRRVRHPMYSAFFLFAIGEALVVPNWIAGPAYLATFWLLFAFRVRAEEQLMLDRFGGEYAAYMKRTCRLVPGIW